MNIRKNIDFIPMKLGNTMCIIVCTYKYFYRIRDDKIVISSRSIIDDEPTRIIEQNINAIQRLAQKHQYCAYLTLVLNK